MTTEAFTSTPPQVINGIGPYPVLHPYGENALVVAVLDEVNGVRTELQQPEYSPDPTSSATEGQILLSPGAASAYNGMTLEITRFTNVEQGFQGRTSTEKSFETALDLLAQAAQDIGRATRFSLRTSGTLLQALPPNLVDATLYFDDEGRPTKGPSAAQIAQAAENATMAMTAAANALSAASTAQAAANSLDVDELLRKDANLSDLLSIPNALGNLGIVQYTAPQMRDLLGLGNGATLAMATPAQAVDTENPSDSLLLSVATATLLFAALQPYTTTYGGFGPAHLVARTDGPLIGGDLYDGNELRPAGLNVNALIGDNNTASGSGTGLTVGEGNFAGIWMATGTNYRTTANFTRATTAVRVA